MSKYPNKIVHWANQFPPKYTGFPLTKEELSGVKSLPELYTLWHKKVAELPSSDSKTYHLSHLDRWKEQTEPYALVRDYLDVVLTISASDIKFSFVRGTPSKTLIVIRIDRKGRVSVDIRDLKLLESQINLMSTGVIWDFDKEIFDGIILSKINRMRYRLKAKSLLLELRSSYLRQRQDEARLRFREHPRDW